MASDRLARDVDMYLVMNTMTIPTGWTAAPNMLLDVKPYGATKHLPAVLVAVQGGRQADRLLVQVVGEIPSGVWGKVDAQGCMEVYFRQTRQCHRFTRTVTKAVKLIAMLAREAGKKRSSAEKLAAIAASRVGRDGECQICANRQIVTKGLLVFHGYERPGDGMAHGECYGRGFAPYEVSCDRLRWYVAEVLQRNLIRAREYLANSPGVQQLGEERAVEPRQWDVRGRTVTEYVQVKRGEAGFPRLLAIRDAQLRAEIEHLERAITWQQGRIAAWKAPA